ncbi:hypothetical protein [Sulfuracidifex metallicus]|uniref:Uncharacterized protein n=1 Tax=Sulfuracidifex metallicus DSM 6482 = JCM 9184 TaxID=523847 RepID=A0A6A9QL20_SULME|nr:hypothetical protein [Sulfuracidifex metallicus]MUN29987.1 hypothetical protein [Sulfuracidifex metallicus DSM 6482 = JCM 9184]WOE51631.1 hypothetical protein RQ359_000951 [Sulfuracidifex metallicus DSM 6482 = JCM 9184]
MTLEELKRMVNFIDFPSSSKEEEFKAIQIVYRYVCPFCLAHFEKKHAMYKHLKNEKIDECPFCGWKTRTKRRWADMKKHLIQSHRVTL